MTIIYARAMLAALDRSMASIICRKKGAGSEVDYRPSLN